MPNSGRPNLTARDSGLLNRPLAIIGLACRLPGADGLDQFWQLLRSGSSAIERMPDDKLDRSLYFDPRKGQRGKTYSEIGGFVSTRELNWSLLPIDRAAARTWDPCHLILCETVAAACRHAGWDPHKVPIKNGAVFVGHSGGSTLGGELAYRTLASDFVELLKQVPGLPDVVGRSDTLAAQLLERLQASRPQRTVGGKPLAEAGFAAGIVSHALGLTGPHMSIDAACASSLVALALAATTLHTGQAEMAIVGGASFNKADSMVLFSQAQSCSASGSRPFDDAADGLISSEGYVAVVLKTLDRAIADGDRVHAVIRGIGISTDGRGKSLWAPRREGQLTAIRRAYSSDVSPDSVQMIEAHATSTQVGDATEMEALSQFFGEHCRPGQRIPVGSVKSNIGHTLETAGLAGLVKAILSIEQATIPPSINVKHLNRSIAWSKIPLYVPQECQPWPKADTAADDPAWTPRRAAVNAFGIGGLNVHVVVEQYAADYHRRLVATTSLPRVKSGLEPVAVIGRGVVLPGAANVDALSDLLAAGLSQIQPLLNGVSELTVELDGRQLRLPMRAGSIRDFEYDWRKHKVPPKQIAQANPLQFMLLEAAEQALRESGCLDRDFDRQNTAVVVGSIFGGDFGNALFAGLRLPELSHQLRNLLSSHGVSDEVAQRLVESYEQIFFKVNPALLDETGSFTSSTLASRLSKTFDLQGGALAIDSGDVSSFAALQAACQLLQSGSANQVLCAAAQRALDRASQETLALAGRLPGSSDSEDGYHVGEGVAVVLLKRLSDAQLHGDPIFATLDQLVAGYDAHSLRTSFALATQRLSRPPQFTDKVIGKVNLGSIDKALTEGVLTVNADSSLPPNATANIVVSPVIALTGHLQAAQGMVDLIAASTLTKRLGDAHDHCLLAGHTQSGQSYLASVWSGELRATDQRYPMASSAAAVERTMATEIRVNAGDSQPAAPRIWRFVASSQQQFKQLLSELATTSVSDLQRRSIAHFDPSHQWRSAVVGTPAEIVGKLALLAGQFGNAAARTPLAEQGIYWGAPEQRTQRVAWLFPGQGSQYAGMLSDLVASDATAARALKVADALLMKLGEPAFEQLAGSLADNLGEDVWYTQAAMLVADWIMLECLRERGHRPYLVTGHSYGEFAAMLAAGCWDLETALRATWHRCQAIVQNVPSGLGMLSIQAAPERVRALLDAENTSLAISHINAAQQVVVGGKRALVVQFSQALDNEGISSRLLAVPTAFHTPSLQPAQATFDRGLQSLSIGPPQIPLLSCITNRFEAEPQTLVENLVDQLIKPIDFVGLSQRLSQEGVGLAVEVGPQQVLTRLLRQNLGESLPVIATDQPKRGAVFQLMCAQAMLELFTDSAPSPQSSALIRHVPLNFDATQMRRDRLRKQGRTNIAQVTSPPTVPSTILTHDATEIRRAGYKAVAQAGGIVAGKIEAQQAVVVPRATNAVPQRSNTAAQEEKSAPDRQTPVQLSAMSDRAQKSIESFLIDFVVEQTGYPAEIIELDWDIEADLGIDSIKKAQLFGELREFFDLESLTNFSLDNFRTLRDIAVMLQTVPGKGQWLESSELLQQAVPAVADRPAIAAQERGELAATLAAVGNNASRELEKVGGKTVDPIAGTRAESGSGVSAEFLQQFLVDFVVEQTGYPAEIVDLDADLEADLGIDSIKKAQLFGELREMFHFPQSADVSDAGGRQSLANYRTLRDVQGLLLATNSALKSEPAGGTNATAQVASPVSEIESTEHLHLNHVGSVQQSEPWSALASEPVTGSSAHDWLQSDEQLSITVQRLGATPRSTAQSDDYAADAKRFTNIVDPAIVAAVGLSARSGSTAVLPTGGKALAATEPMVTKPSELAGIANRYVLQMAPSPQRVAVGRQPIWSGTALIVGNNPIAMQLEARLRLSGVPVVRWDASDDQDWLATQFEQLSQSRTVPHLFITTPCDAKASITLDESAWRRRRNEGIFGNFWLCQRWLQHITLHNLCDSASLVAVTAQGGDFGIEGCTHSAEGGAIAGLLKSMLIESWMQGIRTLPIKVIDTAAQESPAEVVDHLWRELAIPSYDLEVSYQRGVRQVVRAVRKPIASGKRQIGPGSTWVCTGGARGITAYVAQNLAQRYQLRLHLLGTTELPQIDPSWRELDAEGLKRLRASIMTSARSAGANPVKRWQDTEKCLEIDATLRRFAQLGIDVTYHACDVSDREQVNKTLERVRAQSGPIEGILHGAGIGKDARFDRKQKSVVQQCISAKVDGAFALMAATQADPLKYFVGFGSISGRFGANGHTDYSLANEMLCKQIAWFKRQRPEVRAVGFHWHAWGDIGMATKPETRLALEMIDMQFMPAREGLQHLLAELEGESEVSEVLITDDRYYRAFYPAETLVASGTLAADAELKATPLLVQEPQQPSSTQYRFSSNVDPGRDPFLTEHKLDGHPLLPFVVASEMMLEAASVTLDTRQLTMLDVEAIQALRFFSPAPRQLLLESERLQADLCRCLLSCDFVARDGRLVDAKRPHFRAQVAVGAAAASRVLVRLPANVAWQSVQYPSSENNFYAGWPLQKLRHAVVIDDALVGRIAAPALIELAGTRRDLHGWKIPCAAMDACLFATGILAWQRVAPGTALPMRIGRLEIGRLPSPGEACQVHVQLLSQSAAQATFDFTLYGVDGDVLLNASDYQIAWLAPEAADSSTAKLPARPK